jgi:hypothetical protein
MMGTAEDYKKYFCALGSRSVRRVAAKLSADAEIDAELRIAMLKELTQAVKWQRMAALAGWPLNDHVTDDKDGEDAVVDIDLAVYSDGQPVFTIVDWLDGYATLVHHPDGLKPEGDRGELHEELCPCCGGMPQSESDGEAQPPTADS